MFSIAKIRTVLSRVRKKRGQVGKSQATTGLTKIEEKWPDMDDDSKEGLGDALKEVSENLQSFVNAGKNPRQAVASAVAIISSFVVLMGPVGGIAAVALGFIAGILSLFGEGEEPKSMDQIIRAEIERLYERQLTNQARGVLAEFKVSKAYLDGLDIYDIALTPSDMHNLACHIPVYQGLSFMGTLASEINTCVNRNKKKETGKCLKYLELYANIAVFKDLILQQLIVHLQSDSLRNTRRAILSAQRQVRDSAQELYNFLYNIDKDKPRRGDQILMRFEPEVYPTIDLYCLGVLKMENYDRAFSGKYYLAGRTIGNLSWSDERSVPKYFWQYGKPEVLGDLKRESLKATLWKLVPHPGYLYSIFSQKGCPDGERCNKMMATDSKFPMVDHYGEAPQLWRLTAMNGTGVR